MFEIYLENENQEKIEFNQPGGDFTISEIDGLYPSTAIINTDTTALLDGSRYNSSKVAAKEILFAFAIEKNAAENRVKIYRVIQPKKADYTLLQERNTRRFYPWICGRIKYFAFRDEANRDDANALPVSILQGGARNNQSNPKY